MAAPPSPRTTLTKIRKIGLTILVNVLVFALFFGGLEIAYRIHRGGLFDRLNPANPAFNQRSVRGGEVAVPKPPGIQRIVYLGDSVTFPDPLWAREAEAQGSSSPRWDFLLRHSYVLQRIHLAIAGKMMNSGHRYEWEGNGGAARVPATVLHFAKPLISNNRPEEV